MVSDSTAKTHAGRMLRKLGLRDRVPSVILAYEDGLSGPARTRALTPVVARRPSSG